MRLEHGTYFFFKDPGSAERQSIGVYLASDAKGIIEEVIFFCPEWEMTWIGLSNLVAGRERSTDLGKAILKPVSLQQIVERGLTDHVSGVLETGAASNVIHFR